MYGALEDFLPFGHCSGCHDRNNTPPGSTLHNFTDQETYAAALGILGGTNSNCGGTYGKVRNALAAGAITKAQMVASEEGVLRSIFATGAANVLGERPYAALGIADIDTEAHRQLALEAAQQGMVLLKNEGGLLPLKPGTTVAPLHSIILLLPRVGVNRTFKMDVHGSTNSFSHFATSASPFWVRSDASDASMAAVGTLLFVDASAESANASSKVLSIDASWSVLCLDMLPLDSAKRRDEYCATDSDGWDYSSESVEKSLKTCCTDADNFETCPEFVTRRERVLDVIVLEVLGGQERAMGIDCCCRHGVAVVDCAALCSPSRVPPIGARHVDSRLEPK